MIRDTRNIPVVPAGSAGPRETSFGVRRMLNRVGVEVGIGPPTCIGTPSSRLSACARRTPSTLSGRGAQGAGNPQGAPLTGRACRAPQTGSSVGSAAAFGRIGGAGREPTLPQRVLPPSTI